MGLPIDRRNRDDEVMLLGADTEPVSFEIEGDETIEALSPEAQVELELFSQEIHQRVAGLMPADFSTFAS